MYQGSGQVTPCSQSQIGHDRYLGRRATMQAGAVVGLSVVVRKGPVMTGVNGMLVARLVRPTRYGVAPLAPALTGG